MHIDNKKVENWKQLRNKTTRNKGYLKIFSDQGYQIIFGIIEKIQSESDKSVDVSEIMHRGTYVEINTEKEPLPNCIFNDQIKSEFIKRSKEERKKDPFFGTRRNKEVIREILRDSEWTVGVSDCGKIFIMDNS